LIGCGVFNVLKRRKEKKKNQFFSFLELSQKNRNFVILFFSHSSFSPFGNKWLCEICNFYTSNSRRKHYNSENHKSKISQARLLILHLLIIFYAVKIGV
jgi:hypothetical protein